MAIDVVDAPRSDTAILVAMVAWLVAEPIDLKKVLAASSIENSPEVRARLDKKEALHKRIQAKDQDIALEDVVETVKFMLGYVSLQEAQQPWEYLMPLIEHYKPEAKTYSRQEYFALLERTCHHINNFLDALRKLQAFLEYRAPNKRLTPSIREPNRDVKAAVLHDVDGLPYRQIGEKLKVPPPSDSEIKGENQTVRKMVERGRNVLQKAFGEEGWRERVETMRAEKKLWQSLSHEEQNRERDAIWLASDLDISVEEARQRLNRS